MKRSSHVLWHVLRKNTNIRCTKFSPSFVRVRKIIYNGKGFECSCKYFKQVGYCCRHIFALGLQLKLKSFHIRYWSTYAFYYKREGTDETMNASFEALDDIDYVMDDNINAEITYPVFNDETIDIETFNNVMNSDQPVVHNWDK